MTAAKIRILIVDDEPLARQRLIDLLGRREDAQIVGDVGTGTDAVEAIRNLRPDLVFLDVQMPGMSGIDVAQEIGPDKMPVTVFVTAFDQYALQAFELAAVDYLVKPFDDDRFEVAFKRARHLIAMRDVDSLRSKLASFLEGDAAASAAGKTPSAKPLERIAVEMRGQIRIVPVEDIDFITSDGPYAELHAGDDTYLIRERMQTLEDRLDPEQFFRIHRSAIVRLDRVDALLYSAGGDYAVRLKDGKRLKVSRGRRDALSERLGLDALR